MRRPVPLAGGVTLIIIGAILKFALTTSRPGHGLDLHLIGVIVMAAGVAVVALPLVMITDWRSDRSVALDDERYGPGQRRSAEAGAWNDRQLYGAQPPHTPSRYAPVRSDAERPPSPR